MSLQQLYVTCCQPLTEELARDLLAAFKSYLPHNPDLVRRCGSLVGFTKILELAANPSTIDIALDLLCVFVNIGAHNDSRVAAPVPPSVFSLLIERLKVGLEDPNINLEAVVAALIFVFETRQINENIGQMLVSSDFQCLLTQIVGVPGCGKLLSIFTNTFGRRSLEKYEIFLAAAREGIRECAVPEDLAYWWLMLRNEDDDTNARLLETTLRVVPEEHPLFGRISVAMLQTVQTWADDVDILAMIRKFLLCNHPQKCACLADEIYLGADEATFEEFLRALEEKGQLMHFYQELIEQANTCQEYVVIKAMEVIRRVTEKAGCWSSDVLNICQRFPIGSKGWECAVALARLVENVSGISLKTLDDDNFQEWLATTEIV